MNSIKENCSSRYPTISSLIVLLGMIYSALLGGLLAVVLADAGKGLLGIVALMGVVVAGCLISWAISIATRGIGEIIKHSAEKATFYENKYNSMLAEAEVRLPDEQ
ncbi:MAG: hypothetical protein LUH18_04570 [Oscillospiraceae bacterium]|nr:hypothetical protein [Oscillospiraceae bacterium]